jgi:hypothetical protein
MTTRHRWLKDVERMTEHTTQKQRIGFVVDELVGLVDSLICIITLGHFTGNLAYNHRLFRDDEGGLK